MYIQVRGSYSSCIMLVMDGARADVFERLLSLGLLPNIERYIIERGTYSRAVTSFPSTTGPAHLPLITGCFPGRCNIPGIRWLDRVSLGNGLKGIARDYVGPGTMLLNDDISSSVKTAFELIEGSAAVMTWLTKGLSPKNIFPRFTRWIYYAIGKATGNWHLANKASEMGLLKAIGLKKRFVFSVFPAIDELSHLYSPFHKEVIAAYEMVDRCIGRMMRLLERIGRIKDTIVVLISDHGLTPTYKHLDLIGSLRRIGFEVLKFPPIRLLPQRMRRGKAGVAAVMVSGNGMAHVYLGGKEGLGRRAYYEEIRNGKISGTNLFIDLLSLEGVELLASKGKDGSVWIISRSGEARAKEEGGRIKYEVFWGNPLDFPDRSGIYTYEQLLISGMGSDTPDAVVQLLQLFKSPRCGDLVVCMRDGYDIWRSGDPHKGSHGSLSRSHMLVPFAINYRIREGPLRTVDVFPTIAHILGWDVPKDLDGIPRL
jgi:hypothetical protein